LYREFWPAAWLVLAILLVGCDSDNAVEPVTSTNKGTTPTVQTGAGGQVLHVVKNGKIYVLMDLQPERQRLKSLAEQAREEFLMRRALKEAMSLPTDREDFAGKDTITIRMVLVAGIDEYNRPRWGGAAEIAFFHLSRASLADLTSAAADKLPGAALRQRFQSVKLSLENLS
jgi:hypothetical protein